MALQDDFDAAAEKARHTPVSSNDVKGQLYGLFKQATVGDCTGARPSLFNLVARQKHDAWAGYAGKSKEDAMKEYIALVETL